MKSFVVALTVLGVLTGWGQTVLSPRAPALDQPASSFSVASPALSAPVPAPANTTTNLTVGDVSAALLNLQAAVEQTLPALGEFNTNFDFASVPGMSGGAPSGNFSRSYGRSLAKNFGRNFSMNLGANIAANTVMPSIPQTASAPGTPVATGGTNLLTRETLGALLVLQSDIERMLPLLNSLNGTTNATSVLETQSSATGGSEGAP